MRKPHTTWMEYNKTKVQCMDCGKIVKYTTEAMDKHADETSIGLTYLKSKDGGGSE